MVEPATRPNTGRKGTNGSPPIRGSSQSGAIMRFEKTAHSISTKCATCPICNTSVRRLERHMAKAHGAVKLQSCHDSDKPAALVKDALAQQALTPTHTANQEDQQSERKQAALHVCPVCAVQVKSLEKHAKKTGHGRTVGPPFDKEVARSKRLSKRPADMFQCLQCRAKFPNATQLGSHVAGGHGNRAFQKLVYHARSRTVKVPPEGPPNAVIERPSNMDAKHGWGGSFRDNGQFGSYPSYDGMDDESFA